MELTDKSKIVIGLLIVGGLIGTVVIVDKLSTFPPPPAPVIGPDAGPAAAPLPVAPAPATAATHETPATPAVASTPAAAAPAGKKEALRLVIDASRAAELEKIRGSLQPPGSPSATAAAAAHDEAYRHLAERERECVKSGISVGEIGAAEIEGRDLARAQAEAERKAAEEEAIAAAARKKQEEEAEFEKIRIAMEQKHRHATEAKPAPTPPPPPAATPVTPATPGAPPLPPGVAPRKSEPDLPPGMTRGKKP